MDHGYDLGFVELLILWIISECLLIIMLLWLFIDQEQAEQIRKEKN